MFTLPLWRSVNILPLFTAISMNNITINKLKLCQCLDNLALVASSIVETIALETRLIGWVLRSSTFEECITILWFEFVALYWQKKKVFSLEVCKTRAFVRPCVDWILWLGLKCSSICQNTYMSLYVIAFWINFSLCTLVFSSH